MGYELSRIYLAQIINALEYLQEKNIVHRDLKPLNVMLDEKWNIKLIDFGDAKDLMEEEEE